MCKYVGRGVCSKCVCRGQTITFRSQFSFRPVGLGIKPRPASLTASVFNCWSTLLVLLPTPLCFVSVFVLWPRGFNPGYSQGHGCEATHWNMGNWSVASSLKTILSLPSLALDYHLLLWVGWGYCEPLSHLWLHVYSSVSRGPFVNSDNCCKYIAMTVSWTQHIASQLTAPFSTTFLETWRERYGCLI